MNGGEGYLRKQKSRKEKKKETDKKEKNPIGCIPGLVTILDN